MLSLSAPAWAGLVEDCVQDRNPDLQISGCTAVIRSGQWQGVELAPAYSNRGLAYVNLGELRRAIEDYDQALRLDPNFATAYSNRGAAYGNLSEFRRAIQDLDQAVRLDPNFASTYGNRGHAYLNLGQFRRAIQDLDQALRFDSNLAPAYSNRGLAYAGLGELRLAIQDFDQALRLDANDADTYYYRGLTYYDLGELRLAIQDLDQALSLDPGIAGAYANRGLSYANLGNYSRAVQDFDQALRLDPDNELAIQERALALDYLSRGRQAEPQPGSKARAKGPDLDRDTILAAQRMLAQLDLYDGAIDGIVGPITRRAVRQFQETWGYPVTGKINQRLLGQLDIVAKVAAEVAEEEQGSGSEPAAPEQTGESEIQSTGSGFFVTDDGWLLTNRHVVEECTEIEVVVAGNRLKATRKILSLASDLALVKADHSPYRVATFRSGKGIRPGSTVVVVGFPLAGLLAPEINVTTGNVSALAGIYSDATLLQHTAPVQPGNSGGPLLDDSGNVVGIVVSKANAIEFAKLTGDIPENIAFAIKSSIVRDFLDAEGIDYAMASSDTKEDIADLVVRARPYVSLLLCMR